jgi:hypothetical protein
LSDVTKAADKMDHFSIGKDKSAIRALRVINFNQNTLLLVCVEKQLIVFELNKDGSLGSQQQSIHLEGEGNISALDLQLDNQGILHVLVVDSKNTLHVWNYTQRAIKKVRNIQHATFIDEAVVATKMNSSKITILDMNNVESTIKDHDLNLDSISSVKRVKNSLFVFHGKSFNLTIYDFKQKITNKDLESFNYEKATVFKKVFCPSDNILKDEQAHYYTEAITDNYVFVGCSFAESVDVVFQDGEGNWSHAASEKPSIRMLAPIDSTGNICSFKGVRYYPFKFEKDEADTVSYKFADRSVKITAPRKLLTVSYNGKVDVFKCYIEGLPSIKDNEPGKEISVKTGTMFDYMGNSEKAAMQGGAPESRKTQEQQEENWESSKD